MPLSAACAKVPNAFKPFGTIRKKFLLCKSTRNSRYVRSLRKKHHFGAFPEAKNGCCTCSGALKMLPRGPKKCKSLGAIRKKSLLCRKSAILSRRWIFPFSEGWGGSLKNMLILVQRPQHKSTSDPVAAPKNNAFRAIFIELCDTKKCCTFSGFELVPKSRKKLIAALSYMRKGPRCIETLWNHPKKIPFVQKY